MLGVDNLINSSIALHERVAGIVNVELSILNVGDCRVAGAARNDNQQHHSERSEESGEVLLSRLEILRVVGICQGSRPSVTYPVTE